MRIAVKGRNTAVSEQLREHVERRFVRISRQVSDLAELEVELREERNPAIPDSQVAEATLHLKGVTAWLSGDIGGAGDATITNEGTFTASSNDRLKTPGIDPISFLTPSPEQRNSG